MLQGLAGKKKIIILIVGLLALAIAGVAFMKVKSSGGKGAKPEKVAVETTEMGLGEFVVTLADSSQIRYVKTDIVLEVAGPLPTGEGGGHGGEAKAPAPIRDAVIDVLSSRTLAQLNQPHGRDELKKLLIKSINARLEKGTEVKEVFFNEFAMQ
jgi:flagellar protein FliL